MSDNLVLKADNISRIFKEGALNVDVLKDINFEVRAGQTIAIIGQSGSGKSTLLHLLGGLDFPNSGRVELMGENFANINAKAQGQLRNKYLGFVYQFHHLLPEFSAAENVAMPLLIARQPKAQSLKKAEQMLAKVGLSERVLHRPAELSGGERQRTAIARALVTNPACVLADEPTGNLDKVSANIVFDLMIELAKTQKTAFVLVTHDENLARKCEITMRLENKCLKMG